MASPVYGTPGTHIRLIHCLPAYNWLLKISTILTFLRVSVLYTSLVLMPTSTTTVYRTSRLTNFLEVLTAATSRDSSETGLASAMMTSIPTSPSMAFGMPQMRSWTALSGQLDGLTRTSPPTSESSEEPLSEPRCSTCTRTTTRLLEEVCLLERLAALVSGYSKLWPPCSL